MTTIHPTAAQGFADTETYERGRADYPSGIVDAIGITPNTRVADIGCGTGKFTRMVAHADVIGIEPLTNMRKAFHRLLPEIPIVGGVAEAIPLRDTSLDVVSFASAFHWLDHERALPEIHRVLKPGGRLAVIWNRRDELSGWAADLWKITERYRGDTPGYRSGRWRVALESSGLFGPISEHWFDHLQVTDMDGLLARVASASFIELHPDKKNIIEECRVFIETNPQTRGRDTIELPYRSVVYLCENRGHA